MSPRSAFWNRPVVVTSAAIGGLIVFIALSIFIGYRLAERAEVKNRAAREDCSWTPCRVQVRVFGMSR